MTASFPGYPNKLESTLDLNAVTFSEHTQRELIWVEYFVGAYYPQEEWKAGVKFSKSSLAWVKLLHA